MTEGGEQEDDVAAGSNPGPDAVDPVAAVALLVSCLFTLFVVGDSVMSSKSVGKAPSHHEASDC